MVFREKYCVSEIASKKSNDHSAVQVSSVKRKVSSHLDSQPEVVRSSGDDNTDNECGFFCWRPRALQCLARSLWTFIGFYGLSSLCLAASGFYIRSQMTSMERHFRVSTGKMGVLIAANDIGSVAVIMFVSHFGKFTHIPRLLGAVTFFGGLFVSAIALVQAFDPVTLPTVVTTSLGNASNTNTDPLAAMLQNPMLLCVDRPPFLKLMMGEGGNIDMAKIQNLMSNPSTDGFDMSNMMEMMGNNDGAGGGVDMANMMEMMGKGTSGGPGVGKPNNIMGPIGNRTGSGGGMDMASIMALMSSHAVGKEAMNTAQMMAMTGKNASGGSGMNTEKMMALMGNNTSGGGSMDMAKLMEMAGGTGDSGMDMSSMMGMLGMMGTDTGATRWGFYYTFVIMIIIGALGSPRIPLQIYYIETNIKDKTESGIKIGTLTTAFMFGGPMALLIGFAIAMLPVDLGDTQMTFMDPRWIGAWWLGFVIFGAASMLLSLPVFCLPKRIGSTAEDHLKEKRSSSTVEDKSFALSSRGSYRMDKRASHRPSNASQTSRLSSTARTGLNALKEFFKTTLKILTKPVIVLMLLNTFTMVLSVSGTLSFQIKYIENQYDMPTYKISLYLGLGSLGTILLGVFMGGVLTTRLKLGLLGMFRMSLTGNLLALACGISFLFLGCDNHQIVGYNQELGNVTDMGCQCFSQSLLVVCGEDGRNYLSPCLAGCAQSNGLSFSECSYVGGQGTAVPGFCQNCDFFPPFMALFILMSLCMLITITPHTLLIARLVPLPDQPNVTALTSMVFTVGMLVGPIIFGQIYDQTCSLWHPFAEMCVIPDKVALREVFIASDIYIRGGGLILLIIATIVVHCQKDQYNHEDTVDIKVNEAKFTTNPPRLRDTKGVSRERDSGARIDRAHRGGRKSKALSDMKGKGWLDSFAHMGDIEEMWDKDWDGGVIGVSYGKRRSSSVPDIRSITFGKSKLNNLNGSVPYEGTQQRHDDGYDEPDVLPKPNGFLESHDNPVYEADETWISLDVANEGSDINHRVDRDSEENLNESCSPYNYHRDSEDTAGSHQGSRSDEPNGAVENDIDNMFDVGDV